MPGSMMGCRDGPIPALALEALAARWKQQTANTEICYLVLQAVRRWEAGAAVDPGTELEKGLRLFYRTGNNHLALEIR